jgi:ABC-2 type transport system permease protein
MSLPSLFRKELLWSRHRILTLVLLLLLLPAFFAYTTVIFQTVVPEDTPIAIVPETDDVSADGLDIIEGGAALFSAPERYESEERAMRALRREEVYAVLVVPPGILDESTTDATFTLAIDGGMVPFGDPSIAIRNIMEPRLNQNLPADIRVERTVVGAERTLSEFLVPVFMMGMVLLFAFTYFPYNLARESDVLERVLVSTSLDAVIATKILYHAVLLLVPIGAFAVAANALGYSVAVLSPSAIAVFLLTFVYLAAISAAVMVLTDFSALGRFCNVALLFGSITFSSLVYPVGFFSPLRKELARSIPLHHSMVASRSLTLKQVDASLFADRFLLLGGFTLASLLALKLAIEHYKRTA